MGTDLQGVQGPLHGLSLHFAQELHSCCHSLHAHTDRFWRPMQAGSQICLLKHDVDILLTGQTFHAGTVTVCMHPQTNSGDPIKPVAKHVSLSMIWNDVLLGVDAFRI